MATAWEERCPICLGAWDDAACAMPCLHRFCFGCIRRWTDIKPECPLCKRRVTSIRHSWRGDEFEELPITPPAASTGSAQDEAPYLLAAPAAPRVHQPWNPAPGFVGGLYAHTWGFVFREYPAVLQLLRPWLQQELGRIFGEERSQALMLEHMILSALPVCGLHEERLVEELRADLGSRTAAFVQGLIASAVERCERTAHHLLLRGNSRAARGLGQSPRATVGSAGFMRWRERSPVGSTSWAAYRERREGNRVARTSSAGFQGRGRSCVVTCTTWDVSQEGRELSPVAGTSSAASQGGRELSPVAGTSSAASQGGRELSPVAGTSSAASQGGRELSPVAGTSSAASQGGRELSPVAGTSSAASRGGTPAPGPAPSSSAAADELPGTSAAALQGGPGRPLSVPAPVPGEQEEDLHEELGQAAAGASAPRRDRGCSRQGPRSPLKRKASSSEDSAAPAKKPPRR